MKEFYGFDLPPKYIKQNSRTSLSVHPQKRQSKSDLSKEEKNIVKAASKKKYIQKQPVIEEENNKAN